MVAQHPFASAQAGLLVLVKDTVFRPTVEVLYGAAFCQAQDMARLQQAFFSFESGFELAASPVPHALQRAFCAARSHLLTSFRQGNTPHTVLDPLRTLMSSEPAALLVHIRAVLPEGSCTIRNTWQKLP